MMGSFWLSEVHHHGGNGIMKRIVEYPQREDRVEILTENFPLSSA